MRCSGGAATFGGDGTHKMNAKDDDGRMPTQRVCVWSRDIKFNVEQLLPVDECLNNDVPCARETVCEIKSTSSRWCDRECELQFVRR